MKKLYRKIESDITYWFENIEDSPLGVAVIVVVFCLLWGFLSPTR